MNDDTSNTQGRGLTTDQIAAAGTRTGQEDMPQPADRESFRQDIPQPPDDEGFGEDIPQPADDEGFDDGYGAADAPRTAGPAASERAGRRAADAPGQGSLAADSRPRASLLEDDELQNITMRWKDIQAEFVDEPEQAVQEADALVAELMQRLATMFATERADLEQRWAGGHEVSTEDLRQGLRRYRSFFERLLAA
jgi:hypothetical protein